MMNRKRLTKILLVGLILCFCFNIEKASGKKSIRIMTFNIWDPADVPFWKKHADGYPVDRVVKYLTEDKADILLLQEVSLESQPEDQAYEQIKEQLSKKGYKYSAFYRPDYSSGRGLVGYVPGMKNSGYPLAILSKYPIEETFARQKANDVTMAKGVLGVKLNLDDKPLFIFTTHLSIGSKQTDGEIEQVLLPFVEDSGTDCRIIVGGDFNSPPAAEYPNKSVKIGNYTYSAQTTQYLLDAGFNDSWYVISASKDIGKGASCPGQDDFIKRVDQVYFRGSIVPQNAFVKWNLWENIGLVDHVGVIVDFKL
ncbi:hypothetical protein EYV94_09820 [Puteibacter caeruleilacunae]|nr:hypothetical protein EYV94_09820 [Puteibacter caeruleilacunae]